MVVEYGDEVKSMKDLDVYVRWSKTPEVLTLNEDPADDFENFKSSTGLCPVGGTTSYIKEDTGNITPYLVRYCDQVYIYDINTGTFLEINSQAKNSSGDNLNSVSYRTVNQNRMGYDHINNKLYVVTGTLWGEQEIKYIIYDMVKGVKQQLALSKSDIKASGYYYFSGMFFKDGSFFGNTYYTNYSAGIAGALINLSYQIVNTCFLYSRGSYNEYFVKSFVYTHGSSGFSQLYITKFGHRYDEFIYSVNNLREMTTTQHHMNYTFTNSYYTSVVFRSEQYMFRIF